MPLYMTKVAGQRIQFWTDEVLSREEQEARFKKIWDDYETASSLLIGDRAGYRYTPRPWPGLPSIPSRSELTEWLMDLDGDGQG
jgi:hypothetical protein